MKSSFRLPLTLLFILIPLNPGEYRLYTNPVSGMLYLDPEAERSHLTILNSNGQVIRSLEMERDQDHVDFSTLPPGFYLLKRQTGEEAPQYVKVIRN